MLVIQRLLNAWRRDHLHRQTSVVPWGGHYRRQDATTTIEFELYLLPIVGCRHIKRRTVFLVNLLLLDISTTRDDVVTRARGIMENDPSDT